MVIFNSYVKYHSTPRLDNELNRFAAHFEQSCSFSFATSEGGKKQPKWIIISTIVKALVTNVRITTFFGCFDIPRYPHAMNNMNRYHLCFSNITGPLVTGSPRYHPVTIRVSASGHAALLTLDRPLMTAAARCGAQNLQGGSISG